MSKELVRIGMIAVAAWLPLNGALHAEEAAGAAAQPAGPTASIAVPVYSAYVWRGIVVSDKAVAQPNATTHDPPFPAKS